MSEDLPPQSEFEARKRSTVALESIAGSLVTIVEIAVLAVRGVYEGMKSRDKHER